MANSDPGTRFIVPAVPADTPWLLMTPIVPTSGCVLEGEGYTSLAGSIIERASNIIAVKAEGTESDFISTCAFRDLTILGGDFSADLITMKCCSGWEFERVSLKHVVSGRLIHVLGQTQDSHFYNCYFGNGGNSDGSIGSLEIDDTGSPDGGHNQNLLFLNCTWESYTGTAIRIFGQSSAGLINSLHQFIACKLESPKHSNVADIFVDQSKDIVFDLRQIITMGNSGNTKNEMVKITNSRRKRLKQR